MRRNIIAVLLAICGTVATVPAKADTVHEYLGTCRKYDPNLDDCLRPIAEAMARDMASGSHVTSCVPSESNEDQRRLFVAVRTWLKAHPELDSASSGDAALKAMNELYHCRR